MKAQSTFSNTGGHHQVNFPQPTFPPTVGPSSNLGREILCLGNGSRPDTSVEWHLCVGVQFVRERSLPGKMNPVSPSHPLTNTAWMWPLLDQSHDCCADSPWDHKTSPAAALTSAWCASWSRPNEIRKEKRGARWIKKLKREDWGPLTDPDSWQRLQGFRCDAVSCDHGHFYRSKQHSTLSWSLQQLQVNHNIYSCMRY